MVASVPRTAWTVSWGVRTGLAYARCMAAHTVRPHLIRCIQQQRSEDLQHLHVNVIPL